MNSYEGAPDDGSSWAVPGCELRVLRGGGLFDSPGVMRLTFRVKSKPEDLTFEEGFRVARKIAPSQ